MHEEPQIEIPDPSQPDRGRFNFALMLAAAALLVAVGALFFLPGRQSPPGAAPSGAHFAFGTAEQAYASRMRIENIVLSRAENFLHQEITTLNGELVNGGDRALRGVEVTIEFSDELNQIALREARPILTPRSPSSTFLPPGICNNPPSASAASNSKRTMQEPCVSQATNSE
jgi:hypothetical protein